MKRSYEIITAVSLATSLALGTAACSESPLKDRQTTCTGLEFTAPKGGPGAVQIDVFPIFNRNFGDASYMQVAGKIVSGNDKGQLLYESPDRNGQGQFTFTWDSRNTSIQTSVVRANVQFLGDDYACRDTLLQFDPVSNAVTPHLPAGL